MRTRFQQKKTAQLVLEARSTLIVADDATEATAKLPTALPLNDDTRLESVRVDASNDDDAAASDLHVVDQCLLIAMWCACVRSAEMPRVGRRRRQRRTQFERGQSQSATRAHV